MTYFLWSLPALVIILVIVSGRASITIAALAGLCVALPVAFHSGPAAVTGTTLGIALARGLWIGGVIAPYILGGMLFWQVASLRPAPAESGHDGDVAPVDTPRARRRLLFFACFLVGPFAESATGFGVGMLGTVLLIRRSGYAPKHLMIFALLSQTLIPWGAMSSGTLLAAAYARMPATELSLVSAVPVALLMTVWLTLFWRTAHHAGARASLGEHLSEVGWVGASLVLLVGVTYLLGPETALLAAFGPVIVVRYLIDNRPDRQALRVAMTKTLPYAALIGLLALTRVVPPLRDMLSTLASVRPFDGLPAWAPFFHAGSWLIAGAIVTALLRRQGHLLGREAGTAWRTGQQAVLTLLLFAMMAEVLSTSGISSAMASAAFGVMGEKIILLTPVIASALGILTNSGNPANSLLLPSQIALATQAGLSVPAVVALQHVSGIAMGFFSPVRMAIAAKLANGGGQERAVYATLLPYAGAALLWMMVLAIGIISIDARAVE